MALTKVPHDAMYIALSTDIVDDKIEGCSIIGAKVYLVDSSIWKIVKDDLTLADLVWPSAVAG
jgi:hypothetical protein